MIKKFRAWDKKKKKWLWPYPNAFYIIGEVTVFDVLKQYKIKDYNNIEIVQWIGLLDKQKKEIFGGDIIRQNSKIGTYTIIWDKCGFKTKGNSDETSAFGNKNDSVSDIFVYEGINKMEIDYYAIEIIGNIYENKNLLKGEKQ